MRAQAARALGCICGEVPEYQEMVEQAGGLQALIDLAGGEDPGDAMGAYALAAAMRHSESNRAIVAAYGGVKTLVMKAENGSDDAKRFACHALSNLTVESDRIHGMVSNSGGIGVICEILRNGPQIAQGNAAAVIANICRQSGVLTTEIVVNFPCRIGEDGLFKPKYSEIHEQYASNKDVFRENSDIMPCGAVNGIKAICMLCCNVLDNKRTFNLKEIVPLGHPEEYSRALGSICVDHDKNKTDMAKHGALLYLIGFIEEGSPLTKQEAAGAIAIACQGHKENRKEVARRGGIPVLVQLAEEPSRGGGIPGARTSAACALKNLAGGGDAGARENKNLIAESGGLDALVDILRSGTPQYEGREQAALALVNLVAAHQENKERLAQIDGHVALIRVAGEGTMGAMTAAAQALANMCIGCPELHKAMLDIGVSEVLIGLIREGAPPAKEHSARTLAAIMAASRENTARVVAAGGIVALTGALDEEAGGDKKEADMVHIQASLAIAVCGKRLYEYKQAFADAGAIKKLIKLVDSGSDESKEKALRALAVLTLEHGPNKRLMIQEKGAETLHKLFLEAAPPVETKIETPAERAMNKAKGVKGDYFCIPPLLDAGFLALCTVSATGVGSEVSRNCETITSVGLIQFTIDFLTRVLLGELDLGRFCSRILARASESIGNVSHPEAGCSGNAMRCGAIKHREADAKGLKGTLGAGPMIRLLEQTIGNMGSLCPKAPQLGKGYDEARLEAGKCIAHMTARSKLHMKHHVVVDCDGECRDHLLQVGGVQFLTKMLDIRETGIGKTPTGAVAAQIIQNLTFKDASSQSIVKSQGPTNNLVWMLQLATEEGKLHSAAALADIASYDKAFSMDVSGSLGPDHVESTVLAVRLLQTRQADTDPMRLETEAAATRLIAYMVKYTMSAGDEVVSAGGIPSLVEVLKRPAEADVFHGKKYACMALADIMFVTPSYVRKVKEADAYALLKKVSTEGPDDAKEEAIRAWEKYDDFFRPKVDARAEARKRFASAMF